VSSQPITILIAALGGEGGGVLTDWLVDAAMRADLPVQSTSIPGVAQRTGATTYYVEIFPETNAALAGRRPLLALYPSPGGVDVMVATEILEAGRALEGGFVTPDRTTLVAATHRVYAIVEKQTMADGRFDAGRILRAARELAKRPILFDLTRSRRTRELPLNAVLLGALAGCGALPLPRTAFEDAIRGAGIAVDANLTGFATGFEIGESGPGADIEPQDDLGRAALPSPSLDGMIAAAAREFPAAAVKLIEEGLRRLADYQDEAYATLYLERLRPLAAADRADGEITAATARHLALWMSYEDVIRVADLKSRAERMAKVRDEVRAKPEEPVHVTEFFKPGIDEVSAVLPPRLGRALRSWAERRGLDGKLHLPLRLRSTSIVGFLQLRLLARLKGWRRRSLRFAEEQQAIEEWLDAIRHAAATPELAREIAECARLLKGYGDTHKRGRDNYRRIFEGAVRPALVSPSPAAAEDLRRVRSAALADPEGRALADALAALPRAQSAAAE
jgi:indolepyruvate ferredoxin oxidoreductase beta subunit